MISLKGDTIFTGKNLHTAASKFFFLNAEMCNLTILFWMKLMYQVLYIHELTWFAVIIVEITRDKIVVKRSNTASRMMESRINSVLVEFM